MKNNKERIFNLNTHLTITKEKPIGSFKGYIKLNKPRKIKTKNKTVKVDKLNLCELNYTGTSEQIIKQVIDSVAYILAKAEYTDDTENLHARWRQLKNT